MASICMMCGKDFPSGKKMTDHVNSVHDSRELNCDLCGKTVIGKKKMHNHMSSHELTTCKCGKKIPKNNSTLHTCIPKKRSWNYEIYKW